MGFEERYSRQILFPGIGAAGQQRLAAARLAIIGCGATGSTLAMLLARAGVGYIRIVDRDYVEPSNLQRQSLFSEADAHEALPKAIAAHRAISAFNREITIEPHVADLTPTNATDLLGDVQLILDGTDNFETRYLINDHAVKNSIPWIYTAVVASYGVAMSIFPGTTACLACIFPDSPTGVVETCDTSGILNTAVMEVASLSATEAIKFFVGAHDKLRRTLLSVDVWTNERSEIRTGTPKPGCRCCDQRDFIHLSGERRPHITLCGRNSVQIHERHRPLDLQDMESRLLPHGQVRRNEFALRFFREPFEMTIFPDGRAIIKGTTDTGVARSLYARFVGS